MHELETEIFDYSYPESSVATEPRSDFRILLNVKSETPREISKTELFETPREISKTELFEQFKAGDVLVINDTRVERRRIITEKNIEILFCQKKSDPRAWDVLFTARDFREGEILQLPGGVNAELITKGLPQTMKLDREIGDDYFEKHGELALPPYIQKARGERHSRGDDSKWYQTAWAKMNGSQAAPTASLHFSLDDLETLRARGVQVCHLTLHVGIGTFLPVKTKKLLDHKMHAETAVISSLTIQTIARAKKKGHRVWALGTTVVRALESWAVGRLKENEDGWSGETDLFIYPGYKFEVVDAMLTNFHQPRTTLLAMVAAFAGQEQLKQAYAFAVAQNFKLFSYGDLSVWLP